MRAYLSWLRRGLGLLVLLFTGPAVVAIAGIADLRADWRTANRDAVGIAPDPALVREPVLQVYGARAFGWRGAFAVHTWIAAKRRDAADFTLYQVIGWNYWRGGTALSIRAGEPDRRWFGSEPKLYLDRRGDDVEALIDKLETAVAGYPFKREYRTWPGPNSNTFTAWVARQVPELRLELPPTAIGKDYLGTGLGSLFASAPSGTGYQVSLFGVAGLLVAADEGLEVNLLGLSFGLDPLDLAVKLPGIGRLP
ncbi:MAG: DUF3750 domain-containing protein [Kiloniellales bacterium]